MSEQLLETLIQLFAIIASGRGAQDMSERRLIVYDFLKTQFNTEFANKYIGRFDYYFRTDIEQSRKSDNQYKIISRISAKATHIAIDLTKQLSLQQKYTILIFIYEYLNAGKISYVEQGLVQDIIADKFNIPQDEFELIHHFIMDNENVVEQIILTEDEHIDEYEEPKRIHWEDIGGELHYIYLSQVNFFAIRFYGKGQLQLNGSTIVEGHTYIMRTGNSLRNDACAPIFFNDLLSHVVLNLNNHIPINFEARNVVYNFRPDLIGLHQFSFESHSGRMVGIMGVSGSGKSTLANVISGITKPTKGTIYINNIDINENADQIKSLIGYVTQDDILIEDLTVYENLYYAAKLSFDNLTNRNLQDRINTTLKQLGLWEIRDIKVGSPLNKKISGGQRKRLNIALELIREPAMLILDEPTSGLSSQDSKSIIELLKSLTIRGKLIFVVIHQPSSDIYKMFDQLLIIDTGGYLIYDGNPIEAPKYFRLAHHMLDSSNTECHRCGNINVEQVLELISMPLIDEYGVATNERRIQPVEWYEKFNWGAMELLFVGDPEPLPPINFKIPNPLKQIFIYLRRDIAAKSKNLQYLLINLIEAPFLAFMLASLLRYTGQYSEGYTLYDNPNLPVYFVISVIVAFFVGLTVSAEEIIQDRAMLKRETFLNLSRQSYLLSKMALTMILSAVQMALFVLVGSLILEMHEMLMHQWIILFSVAVSANIIGLILSDTMRKTVNIYITIPFMVIPQLILCGVFVDFDKMNQSLCNPVTTPAIADAMACRWAFEALATNQFMYNSYETMFYMQHKQKSQASYYKDYWVPEIKKQLNKALKYKNKHENPEELKKLLSLIETEIYSPLNNFGSIDKPRSEYFSLSFYSQATHQAVNDYLEKVKKYNILCYNRADQNEDKLKKQFDSEELHQLRATCHNKSLADFVCHKQNNGNVIVEYNNRLWQKTDEIYHDTYSSFNAPLFSPYKVVFNTHIDTFFFNLIMIWLISGVLYIVLATALFKHLSSGEITNALRHLCASFKKKEVTPDDKTTVIIEEE